MRKRYAARICWNTAGWTGPTGDAARTEKKGSFVCQNGFGHEEWLFNRDRMIEGWIYGFLQPVWRSWDNLEDGQACSFRLYSCPPQGGKVYVADILEAEVLSNPSRDEVQKKCRDLGWYSLMRDEIRTIRNQLGMPGGGKFRLVLTIRYRPEHLHIFDPPRPMCKSDPLYRYSRYGLREIDSMRSVPSHKQKGTTSPKKAIEIQGGIVKRGPSLPVHNEIQNAVFKMMKARYGAKAVIMEEDCVDIKVKTDQTLIYVDVKPHASALLAVREGVGQLLEYALYPGATGDQSVTALVIVGQASPDQHIGEYLRKLTARLRIPVCYFPFSSSKKMFPRIPCSGGVISY